jgi:hypothetical protein
VHLRLRREEVRRVLGASALQRVDGGLADVPRRSEIGLTDAEGNDAGGVLDQFEEVTDARPGDARDVIGDEVARGRGHGSAGGEYTRTGGHARSGISRAPSAFAFV